MSAPRPIEGYDGPDLYEAAGFSHYLYTRGQGPAVLVMHELPGLTVECRTLCDMIAAQGFRVYLPLMFGKPEKTSMLGNTYRVCVSKEFRMFAADEASPIVDYMRALSKRAFDECGGPGVGVIGMCLTGNFVLSLYTEPHVIAPIAAQPSLPMLKPDALHMTPNDLATAKSKAIEMGPASILGFRYKKDPLCKNAKFERLRAEFGEAFEGTELDGGVKHSTLTDHRHPDAMEKTFAFLNRKLKPQ